MRTSRRLTPPAALLLAILTLLAATLVGCGDDDEAVVEPTPTPQQEPTATAGPDEPTPTSAPAPPTPTEAPAPTPTEAPTMSVASVYWAWTIPTIPSNSPERLGSGGRPVTTSAPATDALEALLDGPNDIEREIAMSTAIPAGTRLLGLTIADGVATVDLSGEFEESGGTLGETMRMAQVVFTLTQFPSVDRVRFAIDGQERDTLGSHGIDVSSGVTRDDLEAVRPLILVEGPWPGAEVADGFHIRGESNTFEATVEWTVTDWDGRIVAEGFTTATAGTGTWGTFDIMVDLPDDLTGRGAVIVFESSPRDGAQTNVVEYPVEIVPAA